jgi:hypothetical protein
MTLALGLQPKLKHKNGSGLSKCFKIQAHSKDGRVQGNVSQTLPIEEHFGISCGFTIILNLWNKHVGSQCGPNWSSNIPLERFWNLDIKSVFAFSFGVFN